MNKEKQKLYSRSQLVRFFQNGALPTEKHFGYLIDSMSNKLDDAFEKDQENGLILSPSMRTKKYISFFDNVASKKPSWYIGKRVKDNVGFGFYNGDQKVGLFLKDDGKVGVGNDNPKYSLDAAGFVGMHGRIGTYESNEIPADGKYHDILDGLNHCQGFEIIARVGERGSGKYSLLHATALATFGKSRNKIRKTCSYFGGPWNKLRIRWKGDTFNYSLQLGTWLNYGENDRGQEVRIRYHITKLWDDEEFMPQDQLHGNQSPS